MHTYIFHMRAAGKENLGEVLPGTVDKEVKLTSLEEGISFFFFFPE